MEFREPHTGHMHNHGDSEIGGTIRHYSVLGGRQTRDAIHLFDHPFTEARRAAIGLEMNIEHLGAMEHPYRPHCRHPFVDVGFPRAWVGQFYIMVSLTREESIVNTHTT